MGIKFNPFTGTFDFTGSVASNSFETIDAPEGTDPVADSATDTLQILAGFGIRVVGDSTSDSITISTKSVDLVSYTQYGGF